MKSGGAPRELRALIVDPDAATRRAAARALLAAEWTALTAESVDAAVALLASESVDVAFLAAELLGTPPKDGVARLRASEKGLPIVLAVTDEALVASPSLALRDDVSLLRKPAPIAELWWNAAVRAARPAPSAADAVAITEAASAESIEWIAVARSSTELLRHALSMADSPAPMLLLGERGTGRAHLARTVHARGARRGQPFVSFSCSAPREADREALLFGDASHAGAIAQAARGTLHLDDVHALPRLTQARLAEALDRAPQARVIASAPADIASPARRDEMHPDLLFRLSVIDLHLPPLRRRPDDIPILAHHFLRLAAARLERDVQRLSNDAVRELRARSWTGNADELRATMEKAVLLAHGTTLHAADLPPDEAHAPLVDERAAAEARPSPYVELPYGEAKERALAEFHRAYLGELLRRTEGNLSEAARRAGLDRANFRRVLRRFEQRPPRRKR